MIEQEAVFNSHKIMSTIEQVRALPAALFGQKETLFRLFEKPRTPFDPTKVGLGWVKDKLSTDQIRRYSFRPTTYAANIDEIKSHSVMHVNARVYNQGEIGSCTANALIGAYDNTSVQSGKPLPNLSRLFLYYEERAREGNVETDAGASISAGIETLKTIGCAEENEWPYSSNFIHRPSALAYENAGKHRALDVMRITQSLRDIKQCLLDGHVVVFGMQVFPSFMSQETAKNGIVSLPQKDEKPLGGHSMYIFGFEADIMGGSFLVQNSWGSDWGIHNGKAVIPWAYLLNSELAADFWAIKSTTD